MLHDQHFVNFGILGSSSPGSQPEAQKHLGKGDFDVEWGPKARLKTSGLINLQRACFNKQSKRVLSGGAARRGGNHKLTQPQASGDA
jgi:hypothetical protein